ncbi:MAG: hypothetical protein AAB551_00880 [Patescibacteria group bacterium]
MNAPRFLVSAVAAAKLMGCSPDFSEGDRRSHALNIADRSAAALRKIQEVFSIGTPLDPSRLHIVVDSDDAHHAHGGSLTSDILDDGVFQSDDWVKTLVVQSGSVVAQCAKMSPDFAEKHPNTRMAGFDVIKCAVGDLREGSEHDEIFDVQVLSSAVERKNPDVANVGLSESDVTDVAYAHAPRCTTFSYTCPEGNNFSALPANPIPLGRTNCPPEDCDWVLERAEEMQKLFQK